MIVIDEAWTKVQIALDPIHGSDDLRQAVIEELFPPMITELSKLRMDHGILEAEYETLTKELQDLKEEFHVS